MIAVPTTYVLMAGLPGTGKSTLANALCQRVSGIVLNKDVVRAALFPERFIDYTCEQDDLCFRIVLESAAYVSRHHSADFIFLDGRPFSHSYQIEEAREAARCARGRYRILSTICPDDVAEVRLARDSAMHPAKNRNAELYRELKRQFEPITYEHLKIDSTQPIDLCVDQALAYLRQTQE